MYVVIFSINFQLRYHLWSDFVQLRCYLFYQLPTTFLMLVTGKTLGRDWPNLGAENKTAFMCQNHGPTVTLWNDTKNWVLFWGGLFFYFLSQQALFFFWFLVLCVSASLLFCFSAFLLLSFSAFFPAFCFSCFSAFHASLLYLLLFFSASLLSLLLCCSVFLLLCFCAFLLLLFCFFFSSVMCFCCSTSCSSASLLPVFTASLFFSFLLLYSLLFVS